MKRCEPAEVSSAPERPKGLAESNDLLRDICLRYPFRDEVSPFRGNRVAHQDTSVRVK